ncbi:MAG: hypothetical protein EBR40_08285 [Proteobacteria bacterium]|nr:hypothetical protein [Pseudomonadota bacterium]
MKGNPALRTILVLLLLAAVAYPVSRVISRGKHSVSFPSLSPATTSVQNLLLTGTLRIKTAPAPLRLEVTSSGKILFEAKEKNDRGEVSKELSLPPGSDLIVRAEWADDRPHALHAEFLPSGTNDPVVRDYWSGRMLEDVLSLP